MTRKKPPARQRAQAKQLPKSPKKGPARPLRLSRAKAITKTGPAPGDQAEPTGPVLIVLGYDDQAKPRAARFIGADPDLVEKAANAMNLEVRPVTSPDLAEAAKRLPVGRLYANGTGFVPTVRQDLYTSIIVALAVDGRVERDKAFLSVVAKGPARTWDEIEPGHVVLAQETLEYGWWEAVVVARTGNKFALRYRDYPTLPTFVRAKTAIGLMSPPAE
jgi:hypothetical protein